jgi:hypothetical protein
MYTKTDLKWETFGLTKLRRVLIYVEWTSLMALFYTVIIKTLWLSNVPLITREVVEFTYISAPLSGLFCIIFFLVTKKPENDFRSLFLWKFFPMNKNLKSYLVYLKERKIQSLEKESRDRYDILVSKKLEYETKLSRKCPFKTKIERIQAEIDKINSETLKS